MEFFWYGVLGLFFAGYLALAGYDYGAGLLLRAAGRDGLTALGPYFLGNEVWLVAAVGVLFGAFPRLEGELISSLYPAILAGLVAAVGVAAAVGALSQEVRASVSRPLPALLGLAALVGVLLAARVALGRGRPGVAFAATAAAMALPVLLVGAALYPNALVSTVDPAATLPVAGAAADPATLRLLSWLAIPLLPALLGFQAMLWWAFRGRLDARTPVFW
ncbi:cytochrome d ubiquinol oxidase subunit II [Rhizomonospora bruguierae]|uniref:cytochrome d ubiquinol oxidase subunit II n=1 Tax=Rhizomonospora bruguierae TaxID=1581705 RepID=UPI001BCEFEF8|nr:cytochrome d ubiquinol oxidase subunit II [Micromonospora sp. NBRC 107566]